MTERITHPLLEGSGFGDRGEKGREAEVVAAGTACSKLPLGTTSAAIHPWMAAKVQTLCISELSILASCSFLIEIAPSHWLAGPSFH